jgi:hypothetical protein
LVVVVELVDDGVAAEACERVKEKLARMHKRTELVITEMVVGCSVTAADK